ncbi:carbohydrate ABC transporter permease [Streptomyces montanisoli]|uniref:Sugar ABC transporter permease n=1 Tax=Streptomyces montanisoli TaxID=2798581 RepID=A0A940MEU0_9ACTN|nr:sugar ABC transporter permease [Streptomyces montanisoli]MBP0461655.1 sugar ABC transporter permease [Streptomyces montanisoli]
MSSTAKLDVRPPRPPTAGRAPGRAKNSRGFADRTAGYVFLLPWFAGLAVFTVGPLLYSLYLSFTDYSLLQSPHWVGLANFREMFTSDPRFFHAARVTLVYVVVSVPVKLALALGVALLLNRRRRGIGVYRSLFYLPSLLGTSVAVALVWRSLFAQGGAVSDGLSSIGLPKTDFINSTTWALPAIILLACWQFGAPMVIFLAGLKQIPSELYDAVDVDGAGKWGRFRHITLPLLSPVIFFNVLLETINSFQAFTPSFIISNGTGGPADSTLFYTLYLYQRGFTDFRFGYASAMAWVLLAAVAILTALMFRVSRVWVFYGDGDNR